MSEIELDELAERLESLPVIDVRTPFEHSGEAGYPCCPAQGHIPGSRNIPVDELFGRSPEELRELVGEPEGSEVVVYCHSGGRSSGAAAMLREAGYNARNYAGSWHEWSHRAEQ